MSKNIDVGWLKCPCCPMRVKVHNREGIAGSPSEDFLQAHRRHIPSTLDESHCPALDMKFMSSRQIGAPMAEERSLFQCDNIPLANGKCICGADLKFA